MENQPSESTKNEKPRLSNCNVNSTFNFSVGAVAIAVAGLIGYFLYQYLSK
jgi:hypothetical protein